MCITDICIDGDNGCAGLGNLVNRRNNRLYVDGGNAQTVIALALQRFDGIR
jgi:hypothetical protein